MIPPPAIRLIPINYFQQKITLITIKYNYYHIITSTKTTLVVDIKTTLVLNELIERY